MLNKPNILRTFSKASPKHKINSSKDETSKFRPILDKIRQFCFPVQSSRHSPTANKSQFLHPGTPVMSGRVLQDNWDGICRWGFRGCCSHFTSLNWYQSLPISWGKGSCFETCWSGWGKEKENIFWLRVWGGEILFFCWC